MKLGFSRPSHPPRRRLKAEINVVPYIDVMLVLLVIFMVVSPLSPVGTINLPRAEQANIPPSQYFEIGVKKVGAQTHYLLARRQDQQRDELGSFQSISALLTQLATERQAAPQIAVLIAGERDLRYQEVVEVMSAVKKTGVLRIGLATQ